MLLVLAVIQKEGPQLKQQVPVLFAHVNAWLQPKLAMLGLADSLDFASIRDLVMGQLEGSAQTVALYAWTSIRTSGNVMMTVIGNVVMVPLVLFYLLYDWNRMLARLQVVVPRRWLDKTLQLARDMDQMLSQYLRGQLLVMAVLAVFYAIALTIAGFEIALPVGIFTGLAVFIPYIGFATGLALALLAALLQFGDWYGFGAVARDLRRRPDPGELLSHAAPGRRTDRPAPARGDFRVARVRAAVRLFRRVAGAAGQRDSVGGRARVAAKLSDEHAL